MKERSAILHGTSGPILLETSDKVKESIRAVERALEGLTWFQKKDVMDAVLPRIQKEAEGYPSEAGVFTYDPYDPYLSDAFKDNYVQSGLSAQEALDCMDDAATIIGFSAFQIPDLIDRARELMRDESYRYRIFAHAVFDKSLLAILDGEE